MNKGKKLRKIVIIPTQAFHKGKKLQKTAIMLKTGFLPDTSEQSVGKTHELKF